MNAGSFEASHRVHAYCIMHHAGYRERKEKAMEMGPGALFKSLAQDTLRQSISLLNPLGGIWYSKCVVNDIPFLVYIGRGTKYPDASSSAWAVVEIDCNDLDYEEDVLQQCTEQLVQPAIYWYSARMGFEHMLFLHTLLQPAFAVKETLAKLPNDPLSSVLLIINGYRK